MSIAEAAQSVGASRDTIYRAVRTGKIHGAVKDGGIWRLDSLSVMQWHASTYPAAVTKPVPRSPGVELPVGTSILLRNLARESGETEADVVLRLLTAELHRTKPRKARLDHLELRALLESRPQFELDYAIENFVDLPTSERDSPQLRAILAAELDDHGSLRLGHLLSALRNIPDPFPREATVEQVLTATEWTFGKLREVLAVRQTSEVSFKACIRQSIAALKPDDLELHRQLTLLPEYDGAQLSEIAGRVLALHESARVLSLSQHDRVWARASTFGSQPWVLQPVGDQCGFEGRPACTVEAIRITLANQKPGHVVLYVTSPGSYKEVARWRRGELGTQDEPCRLGVSDVVLLSCLDSLAFVITGESFEPEDKIEVWVRPPTRRDDSALLASLTAAIADV